MAKAAKKKTSSRKTERPGKKAPDPFVPLETTKVFRWRDSREWLHLGIVLGVALALRLVFFYLNQRNNPVFHNPIMDALYHHEWALKILDGTVTADDVYFRGPLYPYLLAAFYKVSGSSLAFAVFAQHLVGIFTTGLVYLLAREYLSPRASLVAGFIAALYWPFIYFEGDLLIVTTILFLNTLGLLLLARAIRTRSYAPLIACGIAFGLSSIARPSVLIFIPALPLVLYWNRRDLINRSRDWLVRSAILLMSIAVVITPVMVRNYIVGRSVVPVAASGGVNFYIGNNPVSDGSTAIVPGTRADWWGGYYDAIAIAERDEGRELNLSEVSDYFFARGLQWIKTHPGDASAHFFKKFRVFWAGPERANNKFIYFFWNLAGMKYIPLPGFWLIAPLALLGGVLLWHRRRVLSGLYLFIVFYMIGVVAFFVNARFRLPVMPVMIVFAGYAACALFYAFRTKGPRALKTTVMFIVAFVLVNADYLAFAQIRGYSNAFSHTTLGNTYMTSGRRDLALDHYERAWRLNEAAPTQAFQYIARDVTYNIGLIYWEKGLCSRAIEALRRVGPAFDGSTDIYMINALDWLGDCYLRQSKYENAFAVYQELLRLTPDEARATAGLARVYAGTGRLEEAERMLKSVVDPSAQVYVPSYIALAEVQYKLGKISEAIESYTAISKFTGYEKDAFLALAELYQGIGDIDAAIQSLRQAAYYLPPGDPTVDNWIARLQSMR